jgi:hypothetical protein
MTTRSRAGIPSRLVVFVVAMGLLAFALGYFLHPMM